MEKRRIIGEIVTTEVIEETEVIEAIEKTRKKTKIVPNGQDAPPNVFERSVLESVTALIITSAATRSMSTVTMAGKVEMEVTWQVSKVEER